MNWYSQATTLAMVFSPEPSVPERDLLDLNLRLHNRHQRGLVLTDRHAVLGLVLEQVAEGIALRRVHTLRSG